MSDRSDRAQDRAQKPFPPLIDACAVAGDTQGGGDAGMPGRPCFSERTRRGSDAVAAFPDCRHLTQRRAVRQLVKALRRCSFLRAKRQRSCTVRAEATRVGDISEEMVKEQRSCDARVIELSLKGLRDTDCTQRVRNALQQVSGVLEVDSVSALDNGVIKVKAHSDTVVRELMEAVRKLERGYRAVPYRETTWTWRGHRVNYSVAGMDRPEAAHRPPVVAVHGFGGNCHHWRKLTADLCGEYRVYAPDLLGFGASEKPVTLTYDPHLWFEQIADFLTEVVREPCVLIGNSIGSQVAMYVASERQALVRGACLLNCVGGMNQRGLYGDSIQLLLMRPIFELLEAVLKRKSMASWLFSKFRNRDRVERLLKMKGTPYANPDAVHSELVDIFVDPSLDAGAVDVFVGVFTGDPGPRPERMLDRIECPVLVAWGEDDPWTPIDGSVGRFFRAQVARRSNLQMVPLPKTGHSPQDDRPELVAAALLPWMAKLGPAT